MPRFGDYESVREVYQGGLAVVYTARPPGSAEEKLALKVLQLPVYLADEERVEQESVLFLEASEAQRRVAAGSPLWAPVHASGRCEGGAWYATDFFERSAEKLVLHRRELEPTELFRVVDAVVQGLIALRQVEQRPHGNLKTTNILVSGRGDVSGSRVALTDPIPGSRVKLDEDAVKDLKDLGDLVHQLVMHRPMRSAMAWPLQQTAEWQRLGRVGGGWLELCNALLNPTGAPPPLDEVAGFLPELAPVAKPTGGSSALVGGATPQPGSGPATPRQPASARPPSGTPVSNQSRADMSRSRPASTPGSSPGLEATVPQESWGDIGTPVPPGSMSSSGSSAGATPIPSGSHPGLAGPARPGLGKWKEQEPASLPEGALPQKSKTRLYAAIGVAAVVVLAGAGYFLTRGNKPKPVDPVPGPGEVVKNPEPAFTEPDPRDVPFKRLAEDTSEAAIKIRDLLKQTSPDVDLAELNAAIARFDADRKAVDGLKWSLATKDTVVAGIEGVRAGAKALQQKTQSFGERSPDPRVKARGSADRAIAAARAIKDAVASDVAATAQIDQELSQIQTQYSAADPTKPAWKPGQDNPIAVTYAKALEDAVASLAKNAEEIFAKVPDPRAPEQRQGVETALAEAAETSEALRAINKPDADLEKDLLALRARVADLDPEKVKWTVENVAAVCASVASVQKSADATLKKARDSWTKNAADPRPAARAAAEKTIPTLDSAEQQAKAALGAIPKVAALSEAQRTELTSSIQSSIASLGGARAKLKEAIDASAVPQWGVRAAKEAGSQVERLGAAESDARKASGELAALLKKNESVMAAAVEQHRKDLVAQGAAIVAALNSGMLHTDALEGAPLAERYKLLAADSEFGAVKTDAAIVEAGQRLARLGSIAAGTDPAFLIKELRAAAGSGQVAEGWLALSRLRAPEQKNVPTGGQELAVVSGAIAQLRDAAGRVSDAARAKDLSAKIDTAGRDMWRSYMARLDFSNAADLKSARDSMPALGLKDADLATLGGRERFNFMLADFRASLAGASDEQAGGLVTKFRAEVQGLDPAVRDQQGVVAALAGLEQAVNVATPAAPPPPDFSKLGPGLRGWSAQEGKAHGVDIVTYKKGGSELVFARANEGSMVLTTEVSLGQFTGAVSDAGKWSDFTKLLPAKSNRSEGPRVWVWSIDGDRIELATPAPAPGGFSKGWLAEWPDKIKAAYPPAMADRIAPPDLSMPMQYVSAAGAAYVAGLLGCRLPSTEEWAAALKTEIEAGGAPKPNRRDQTWEEVRLFDVEQSQLPQNRTITANWPDDGIFLPPAFPANLVGAKAVPAVSENDGVLWFMPVDQGGGTVFHHLVGNVSEFVYDKPAEMEGLEPAADVITAKLGSNSDKAVQVIGASALSPPEIQPATGTPSRFTKANPSAAAKCDVGFRLAFTSKSGPPKPKPLAERVRDASGNIAFLPPK